ncbi:MAG: VanW family protein [Lachnospiraceae bacterium]|nr:VanW family protein [Lachnospiraceae bacterium]
MNMKKFLAALSVSLLIAGLVPVSASAAADKDTIEKGIYIGDIDVSGMSVIEAKQAVLDYVDSIEDTEITLNAMNNNKISVPLSDLSLTWENEDVVKEAAAVGKEGNIVKRYKVLKDLQHENKVFDLVYDFDKSKIKEIIETDCEPFNVSPQDATLRRENGEFIIEPGMTGVKIDVDSSVNAVYDYLINEWNGEAAAVDLVVAVDEPRGTEEELSQVKDVLGTFTTDYSSSGSNRSGNVANGARLVNGTLLYPGDSFSMYETVSPFTEENGYYLAGSYLNGMVVESLGGGICQVSTTLYNAVLRAELEVTERSNHSMIVTYVDPSADAAIAGTSKDFKFVNNLEHPIYIEGYTANKKITFTVYGVETRPSNREVIYESEVISKTVPEGEKVVADGSHAIGYINVQSSHTGYVAQLWKIVKEDGVEVSREQVNKSTYKATPRTATVGTASGDPNASAAVNAAIASQSIAHVRNVIASVNDPAQAAAMAAAQQQEAAAAQQAAAIAAQQAAAQAAAEQAAAAQQQQAQ